jgi:glycerol-3-phosphate dehydrogenase
MTREDSFLALEGDIDVLVIGGGATGLGIAVDAVTRGFRTALVEAGDFAQATSSRATKLVHGGVRYLASGQIHLVYEALHERAVMWRNAPHLVHPQAFVMPTYTWHELPYYGTGLMLLLRYRSDALRLHVRESVTWANANPWSKGDRSACAEYRDKGFDRQRDVSRWTV